MLEELVLWIVVAGALYLAGRPLARKLRRGGAPCGAEAEDGRSPCAGCGLALNADPSRLKCRPGDRRPLDGAADPAEAAVDGDGRRG